MTERFIVDPGGYLSKLSHTQIETIYGAEVAEAKSISGAEAIEKMNEASNGQDLQQLLNDVLLHALRRS